MKTTLEISDHLLARVKGLARKRKTTLRSLTEEGLRKVLEAEEAAKKGPLHPVTFKGKGLQPEFREASWREVREAAYGDR
ncbi:MAG: hypothetical protein R6V45_01355 [Oceanipulchritudo sp.]